MLTKEELESMSIEGLKSELLRIWVAAPKRARRKMEKRMRRMIEDDERRKSRTRTRPC